MCVCARERAFVKPNALCFQAMKIAVLLVLLVVVACIISSDAKRRRKKKKKGKGFLNVLADHGTTILGSLLGGGGGRDYPDYDDRRKRLVSVTDNRQSM